MLLHDLSMTDLAEMYQRHSDRSPFPQLQDADVIGRARDLAKKNGTWDMLSELDGKQVIPVLKRSEYRSFLRTGDRSVPEARERWRRRELERAVLALWLRHPRADVDYLQDLIWAYCHEWTWVMAAHESRSVDLGSVAIGRILAEARHVLGEHIEEEVKEKILGAVEQHIFDKFMDYRQLDNWEYDRFSWMTGRNNWNHVCNGEIVRTALYLYRDPAVLARLTHPAIQNMTYALDAFPEDGGCREGPGYWNYGFGHYLQSAHALYQKTNGELNIMEDDSGKIKRICRFPLAVYIDGPLRATFADSHHGYLPALPTILANFFHEMPELFTLCECHSDNTLKVTSMYELALYDGSKVKSERDDRDYPLPDTGQVKMRGVPAPGQLTLCCLAGDNDAPHNHNDIGSFILHKHGRLPLTDPGGPVYRRETFGPNRYDILYCNSLGHSVPLINGQRQLVGSQYYGRLKTENLNGKGIKKAVVDMTNAYPRGTVKQLIRTFELDAEKQILTLEDKFEFDTQPQSLEEAFITLDDSVQVKEQSVEIGPAGRKVSIEAKDCPGQFQLKHLKEESEKWGRGEGMVTRICFIPASLNRSMVFRFIIQ